MGKATLLLVEGDDSLHLFVEWKHGVDPVYGHASPLHSPEPRHLPFGELVYGDFELGEHLLIGDFPDDILGDELILQSVIDEVFGLHTVGNELSHLVDHPPFEAVVQAPGDACPSLLARDIHPHYERWHGRHIA